MVTLSKYGDENDVNDSSDEEYVPPLCLRMTGSQSIPFNIDEFPVIGLDETVHDEVDCTESIDEPLTEQEQILCGDDLVGKHASIVYDDNLKLLANVLQFPLNACTFQDHTVNIKCDASPPFTMKLTSRGTATVLQWFCSRGHNVWTWNSQPKFKYGMQGGDFMLASNILLSGNNYAKIKLLFQFMNMGVVAKNTFYSIQDAYCTNAVKEFWTIKRAEVIQRHQSKDEVVVLADGRMDSPGHCAQYCTYTTMENDSKDIVHVVTIDKRETQRNSVIMEKKAFIQTVDQLSEELKLKEVVTDAHRQISALMDPVKGRYKDKGIVHSLDMWHGAKNLAKRLHAAGMIAGQHIILIWLKDIVNHFWFSCKAADHREQFMDLWTGVLHHVINQHTWAFGQCQHGSVEADHNREWMKPGSVAHEALSKIVLDARWLKAIDKYLRFRTTADLESFQNHILMYASKRFSFSPPVYEARTLLAALDYNHHNHRPILVNAEGNKMYRRLYNKKSKRWCVYALKTTKDYMYIPELQRSIVRKRIDSATGLSKRRPMKADDPRALGNLPDIPPPPTAELVQAQLHRGDNLA
ncbi:hypothetical protein R3I93_009954 [Phoxinus phoxinus]|uniref:Uncharacterized protein n=1 Tax=Phoxinus phoxinus TaxID=58324 RepID=A0AAN9D3S9_9TELE